MDETRATATSLAIIGALWSPNVSDSNGEAANVVDVIDHVATEIKRLANAITPNICGSDDETGGHVESLTEAVMGVSAGLVRIADSISDLAEAVRESKQTE